jgi:hypothetical protein
MNGGKPIAMYSLQIVNPNNLNNVTKKTIEDVLSNDCVLYKEIYITPEKDRGYVYFHGLHDLNLGLQAFRKDGGYNIVENPSRATTSRWMDGSE